jgi:hypothetical protein
MPCLLERDFTDKRRPKLTGNITPGCEWVMAGEGKATRKWDGTACLVRNGHLFKRYDAKHGKPAPAGFEPAGDPDPVTGHWPGWVPVDLLNPESADVWHALTWWQKIHHLVDATYELVGPRINANNEHEKSHRFVRHGAQIVYELSDRSIDGLRAFLGAARMEGIVFWRSDDPGCEKCKIRRDDFGFPWPTGIL